MLTDTQERLEWRVTSDGLVPILTQGKKEVAVTWAPQPGSQEAFLSCPVFEAMFSGTRGNGKSDTLVMSYLQHVGRGWGAEWRGILFRRTYPELQDIIEKCSKWIPRIFPGAKYNQSEHYWTFPTKEQLFLRHFKRPSDYWSYHGHSYPWIGWEELTTWPTLECYLSMFSCARSTVSGIPILVRSTTNPYGVGHNVVKSRFRLKGVPRNTVDSVIRDSRNQEGELEPERVCIHGRLSENKILLHAQPNYAQNIKMAARNPAEAQAWLYEDWSVVAGGMFDDVWNAAVHMIPNFPFHLVPRGWLVDRAYDHGQSAPFSVGWWLESNGEPIEWQGRKYGTVRGDIIRFAEWYGWTGHKENEGVRMLATKIADGINDRQVDMGMAMRVRPGPADSSIFDDFEPGKSVAGDMASRGVTWTEADKRPGSRVQGWQQIRKMLENAKPKGGVREEPGLFICERCEQFERTVPELPRDDKNLDDVDTNVEDHIGDETRYRLRRKDRSIRTGAWK